MLESYDTCMKERADQTLLPQNMLDHVRVQHPISPYTFLGEDVLAYEASVDFIGTLVEINNKIDKEDENAYIAKDLNTKQLRKCQDSVNEATKEIEQDLDKAKYMQKAKRKIWEVYGGNSELTKELRRRGHQARTFGVHNGWDFNK